MMLTTDVDLLAGNPSRQTSISGTRGLLPTSAACRNSDNLSVGRVEQSGVKGAKRPETNGYSAHSQEQGPRAKRLDMTQSESVVRLQFIGA